MSRLPRDVSNEMVIIIHEQFEIIFNPHNVSFRNLNEIRLR